MLCHLVSLFSQSGLHAEACEIDHKLHAIIAGRRRNTIQSIQEETGASIYFPSPLQDFTSSTMGATQSQTPIGSAPAQRQNSKDVIWITGEFFGVQRARDMLYKLSLQKVRRFLSEEDLSTY